jgi:VNT family MFS transporter (synaptic vesicle glycoprotein 2)
LGNKFPFFFRLGGSGPVIWSYFAEFQPKAKRGSMLSFMAAFWTLGNLFVACESRTEEFQQINCISSSFDL